MTLADTIRSARERLGLTQAQLAERAGCSRITIIAIEKGQGAQQRTLEAIATVLGMQLATTQDDSQVRRLSGSEMGKAIKARRLSLGWSQQDTADALGVSRATLIAFEQGRGLEPGVVFRIADVLRINVRLDVEASKPKRLRPDLEDVTWETLRGKRFPNVWELMAANRGIR